MDPESELLDDTPVRLPRKDRERELLDVDRGELWRPPRWAVLVVLGVTVGLLAGGLAWYADGRARAHETAALAGCRDLLHDAVVSSDLEMMLVAGNIRPSLASTTGTKHAVVVSLMSVPARRLLPDVVRADRVCRSVSVRPWHFSLRSGRDAATAYSAALAAKLRQVAADGNAYYRDDRSLRRLRRAADLGVYGGRY